MGNEIAKKLLLHKAKQVLIMNEPDGYLGTLSECLPENVRLVKESSDSVDFVHLFVRDSSELNQFLGSTLSVLKKDGLLWISYPKKSSKIKSDLNRDILVCILRKDGYEGVSLISIDDTWSAMRVKPIRVKLLLKWGYLLDLLSQARRYSLFKKSGVCSNII